MKTQQDVAGIKQSITDLVEYKCKPADTHRNELFSRMREVEGKQSIANGKAQGKADWLSRVISAITLTVLVGGFIIQNISCK